jgi:hypothetical protein
MRLRFINQQNIFFLFSQVQTKMKFHYENLYNNFFEFTKLYVKPHGFREHCPWTDVSVFLPITTWLQSNNETNHLKHKFTLECSSMQ